MTLSSWLKQTILLCYKQADQQALDLVHVKAYLVRRQQYVSGTSGGGTTSPRSFPLDQVSSERKEGEGEHPLQPSLQESNPRV